MTGYEQELRKLFENSGLIDRPQFSGRVCVGELGKDLRVRAELFSAHVAADYDAIRLAVLNRTEGVVDKTLVRFEDVWGKRIVPGNPNFRSGVIPHLRSDYGELDWYVYHPDAADYDILRQAIGQYLSAFRERVPERSLVGSKLVYICAPLQGNVKRTSNLPGKRRWRCLQMVMSPSARTYCFHTPQIRITRSKTLKPRRCPCVCWKPASRSTSTVPSGQTRCGMRSIMPVSWEFR